jgi:hypothetical protein
MLFQWEKMENTAVFVKEEWDNEEEVPFLAVPSASFMSDPLSR